MSNPNLVILELVAHALGPVCDDVVFVGGCATGLLLTQARPDRIRITEDVDIIAQALTARDYHAIEDKVRACGFSNDMRPGALRRQMNCGHIWPMPSVICWPTRISIPRWPGICRATRPAKDACTSCATRCAGSRT